MIEKQKSRPKLTGSIHQGASTNTSFRGRWGVPGKFFKKLGEKLDRILRVYYKQNLNAGGNGKILFLCTKVDKNKTIAK